MINKIFTNGEEGKILTSVGNRIIKQPYEFGNGVRALTGSLRLKVSNLGNVYAEDFAVSLLYNKTLVGNYDGILNFSLTGQTPSTRNYSFSIGNLNNSYTWRVDDRVPIIVDNNPTKFLCITKSGATVYSYTNSAHTNNTSNIINVGGSCDAYIGFNFDSGQARYLSSGGRITEFAFFNRYMPVEEVLYRRSNMSISGFQSLSGCICYLPLSEAEILDFSALQDGSDMRVGCRDYSGYNRHGEIMNLPAGTLQQKVDYANANLFVLFI